MADRKKPDRPAPKRGAAKSDRTPVSRRSRESTATERLAALRATGLFPDLDADRLARLRIDLAARGSLAEAIEQHLRHGPKDIVLQAPQSIEQFETAIGRDVRGVLEKDPGGGIVHLAGVMYRPDTFHQWVATFNAALRKLDDARRFVPMSAVEYDEPLYLLATPPQREALATADVIAFDSEDMRMPPRVSPQERAAELAKRLGFFSVPARADDDRVAIEFADFASTATFVLQLRRAVHRDARRGVVVEAEYGDGREWKDEGEP